MFKNVKSEKVIVAITALYALISTYISFSSGYLIAYNDAAAHLNTARRVVDNLTPGLVQLGSVWLPLLHIIEIPFVLIDPLWTSGLAGSIVSGISFVIAAYFLFKLIDYVTHDSVAAAVGVFVFIMNANLLYMQTTAMFEPLLMLTATGATYFMTKWACEANIKHLVIAAFFTMLATLTRYDGWTFFLASCGYVFIVSVASKRKQKEGPLLLFLFLAGFGLFLWFLYNYLIFSDPLFFARSEYSAAAQQQVLWERGQLPTKHNWELSWLTYSLSTLFNVGVIVTVLLGIGALAFIGKHIARISRLAPLLLAVPYPFNIISLYMGQSVIWLPMLAPFNNTYFNARYGILMLPAAAFFIGYISRYHLIVKIIISLLVVFQLVLFLQPSVLPLFNREIGMITLQDTVSSVNEFTMGASQYLHESYDGGLIMVSSASSDAFIYRSGIPLKNYITEGTGHYWHESLEDPARYATWVVFFQDTTDRVGKVVAKKESLHRNFHLVYKNQTYQIWKKN